MTSTALTAVRSRSSLRVSMRRDPSDPSENLSPQSKRPRLHPPSRRRKSSPDLLDTTIENPRSSVSKFSVPRRASTRRPPFPLSSSAQTTTTLSSHPPPPGTPFSKPLRIHHHETPTTASAALYLNGSPESPDPLDTISPAPATVARLLPKLPPQRRTYAGHQRRRLTQELKPEPDRTPDSAKLQPGRASRGIIGPSLADSPPQSTAVTAGPVVSERRSLRSHDGGSRARSELALYFPNYENLLSLEPPKTEFIAGNTVIKLIDDLTEPPIPASSLSASDADTPFGNPLVNLHGCEKITLPDLLSEVDDAPDEDPLNEDHYFRAHRRNERQEKQLRNIERDRAQHEKQQLDRLLDELQGQDWLRVMGINGISDTEKKLYEPKRDYFIKEISALLQKFKIWKEEEKRRKLEKDKPSSFHSDIPAPDAPSQDSNTAPKEGGEESDTQSSSEPPPDLNDVDALAARQLHQEARSATAGKRPKQAEKRKKQSAAMTSTTAKPANDTGHPPVPPPPEPEPDTPFTSFYSKPHLRELAMSKNRKNRTRLAFGHPIPEIEEQDFQLPSDILTPEAITSCQRKRRRMKRASKG